MAFDREEPLRRDHRTPAIRHGLPVGALIFLLTLSPLPYGSNHNWAQMPFAVGTAVVVLATAILNARHGSKRSPTMSRALLAPAILWLLVILWGAVQATGLLSGNAVADVLFRPGILDTLMPPRIAIDPGRTGDAIVGLLMYGLVFWLGVQAGASGGAVKLICACFVFCACLVTLFGFVTQVAVDHPLSGTYINPDNYATYVGLAAVVCLTHIHEPFARSRREHQRTRTLVKALSGPAAIWMVALMVLAVGLFYSRSKGAVFAFCIAAPLSVLLLGLARGSGALRTSIAAFVVACLYLGAFAWMGQRMMYKIENMLSKGELARLELYRIGIEAIQSRPLTGWGLSSFESIYPMFQTPSLKFDYDRVHSLYLEAGIELGLFGAACLFASVLFLVARCFAGMRTRNQNFHIPAMAVSATIFVGLHSLVDFGLQIPATAASYAALLGMGWAQSWSSRGA